MSDSAYKLVSNLVEKLHDLFHVHVLILSFIALCFLKNNDLIEPQKYLLGGLFLYQFLITAIWTWNENYTPHRTSNYWAYVFFNSIFSVIIVLFINAVSFGVVWLYKYIKLTSLVDNVVVFFSSNWP